MKAGLDCKRDNSGMLNKLGETLTWDREVQRSAI